MSQARCPYCGASEGRCVVAASGRFLTECRSCGRIVEERLSEVEELFVERAHDAPLCIVTPDFSENELFKAPPIEDDPFESIGFITAFSTWSLERSPLFTATSTSFSGQLAELERVLSDSLYLGGATVASSLGGAASISMVEILRAYFQIVEVSSVLGLERDSCDHAIQLVRDCLSITHLRNRNIEALATAALVQAIREGQEPRTLQEISAAANIPQKEIGKHMKVLSDALKLSQPINSNSISVHMPRFCNFLQLSKTTQDLATHIGEVVINKSFCTRRNPISISAAAIYLSCQLEDKRKTQTEICKATGLTEVTLRKVYKELLENLDDILPDDYIPAVPLEKAFPGSTAALGRVHVGRAAAGVSLSDPLLPMTPYNSAVSNNSAGLAGDTSSGVGNSGATSPAQPTLVQVPVSGVSATDRVIAAAPCQGSTPPTSDGRSGMPVFTLPYAGVGEGALERTRLDGSKEKERDRSEQEREKERERDRPDSDYGGLKNVNMMPAASVSGFQPSFFPFAPVDPRVFQEMNPGMWPLQLYGTSAMRPEEGVTSTRGNDRSREDGAANAALPNSKPPKQYVSFIQAMPDGLNPSLQVNMHPLMQGRPPDAAEKQGTFEQDRGPERGRDHGTETGEIGGQTSSMPTTTIASLQAYAAAAVATTSGRPGFPPGLWPFVAAGGPAPYGVFHPQLVQTQGKGLPNQHGASEKKLEGLSQGIGGPGVVVAGQASGLGVQSSHPVLPWPGAPYHPLFLPATVNVGPGPACPVGSVSNGVSQSNGMKSDRGGGGVDGNVRSPVSGGINLSLQPGTDHFQMLSIGGSHGQIPSGHPNPSQHPDKGATFTTSAAMGKQPSLERQVPQGQH